MAAENSAAQKSEPGHPICSRESFLCAEKEESHQFKLLGNGARLDAVVDVQLAIDAEPHSLYLARELIAMR